MTEVATSSPCPACGKPQSSSTSRCDGCGLPLLPSRVSSTPAEEGAVEDSPARKKVRPDDDTQRLELPPEYRAQRLRLKTPARPVLHLVSGVVSSAGIVRSAEPDEDSVLVIQLCRVLEGLPEWFGFYAVADGMGGQEAGEVASRLALEALSTAVLDGLGKPWLLKQPLTPDYIHIHLNRSVEEAHRRVQRGNQEAGRDMGTTLTACLVLDSQLYVINVGDSRVYLYRQNRDELIRVSRDQSLVQQLVEAGEISDDEVYSDPRRNIILSSLGGDGQDVGAESFVEPLSQGDKVLLCSDGLWEMIRDHDLLKVIDLKVDAQQCAEDMVTLACINGGADNVSAIVVELQSRQRL